MITAIAWVIHGCWPCTVNIAQTGAPTTLHPPDKLRPPPANYVDFLKCYEQLQNSGFTASIVHIGNFFCFSLSVCLLMSLGLDFAAIDHIFGNKSSFSNLFTFGNLLTITLANGSKT